MKVGLTVWDNRISPVFDASRTLMVAEIKDNRVVGKNHISMRPGFPHHQISRLLEHNIQTLICGAISEVPAHMAESAGILLIPFVTGNVEDVLEAYISGQLTRPTFLMPGFRRRRRRRRAGF